LPALVGRALDAPRRIVGNDALGNREGEDAPEKPDRAGGRAGAALHNGLAAQVARLLDGRCPARCHVAHEAVHVGRREVPHELGAEKRLDVPLDPAAVHLQRARLLRQSALAHDEAAFGRLKVAGAQLPHRHGVAAGGALLGRVLALQHGAQVHERELAGLLGRELAVMTKRHALSHAGLVPIVRVVDPLAGREHAHAEAWQVGAPHIEGGRPRLGRVNDPLRELRHSEPLPFPGGVTTVSPRKRESGKRRE